MKRFLLSIALVLMTAFCCLGQKYNRYNDSYNFKRGVEAYSNDNYEEGLRYLNMEVEEHPQNGYAFTLIAIMHYENDEPGRALTASDLALQTTPKKDKEWLAYIHLVRSYIYDSLDDDDAELDELNQSIACWPKDPDVYEMRANFFYQHEDYDSSDADLAIMKKLDSSSILPEMYMARNMIGREDFDSAVKAFDNIISLYPDYGAAFSLRAQANMGLKDYPKAVNDAVNAIATDMDSDAITLLIDNAAELYVPATSILKVKAKSEPGNGLWPFLIGGINEENKKYDLAIEAYQKAFGIESNASIAQRIAYCHKEKGDIAKALEIIDKAIGLDPDEPTYRLFKAECHYYNDDLESAIAVLDGIIESDPENDLAYLERGSYNEYKGDFEDALEDFTTSIVMDPDFAYGYVCRGRLYAKMGDAESAAADFNRCIELDPDETDGSGVEYAYLFLGHNEKAVEILDKHMEESKGDINSLYNAACLYSLMGDTEKAIDYLRQSFEAGYKGFTHIRHDTDMDNIRDTQEFKDLIGRFSSEVADSLGTDDEERKYEEKVVEVPFTRANGVTKVKCEINGVPLQFIFDTGAADVSISSLEATFMYKNDYLTDKDVIGKASFSDATGNISVGTVINLRKVTFAGLELDNVRASVVSNDKAPLLLGQTVLNRLGKVEIDYEKSVLRITTKVRIPQEGE